MRFMFRQMLVFLAIFRFVPKMRKKIFWTANLSKLYISAAAIKYLLHWGLSFNQEEDSIYFKRMSVSESDWKVLEKCFQLASFLFCKKLNQKVLDSIKILFICNWTMYLGILFHISVCFIYVAWRKWSKTSVEFFFIKSATTSVCKFRSYLTR